MRKFVKMTNASLGTRESAGHHEHKLKSWAETNVSVSHRRRRKYRRNVKFIAAVWGTEIIKFFAALAILH